MIYSVRDIESELGDGRKLVPPGAEMENYRVAKRSIHAAIDIRKSE